MGISSHMVPRPETVIGGPNKPNTKFRKFPPSPPSEPDGGGPRWARHPVWGSPQQGFRTLFSQSPRLVKRVVCKVFFYPPICSTKAPSSGQDPAADPHPAGVQDPVFKQSPLPEKAPGTGPQASAPELKTRARRTIYLAGRVAARIGWALVPAPKDPRIKKRVGRKLV